MKIVTSSLLAVSATAIFSLVSFGQEAEITPISADRPSVGIGTDLTPVGASQIESGVAWNHDKTSNTFDGPESEIRIGVSKRFELQMVLPNSHWPGDQPGLRMDDLVLGAKIRIGSDSAKWPIAVIPALSLPSGSRERTSGGVDPAVTLSTSHNLPHTFQFYSSLNMASISGGAEGRVLRSQLATDLGWCLNARTCLFAEEAPFVTNAPDSLGHTFDAGMTWRVAPLAQFDWRIGMTALGDRNTTFVSVGYSRRRKR